MLQYIINVSAIWLISLVIFEVFLRRQSFHHYNRLYLITTLVAGALLPLCHWQHSNHIVFVSLRQPVDQFINLNQNFVNTSTFFSTAASVVIFFYFAGCAVAFLLLLSGIVKLALLYTRGRKYRSRHNLIVETGSPHSPCSFLHIVFVSDRKLFSTGEWEMLLTHEQEHHRRYHVLDMLVLQLAQIIFWFHPLPYAYRRRLLLVHEYQADEAARQPAHVYGRFLAEQLLLQQYTSVSHALSNMPIARRIKMLSYHSRGYSHLSKLLLIPLLALFMICFTRYDTEYRFVQSPQLLYPINPDALVPFLHIEATESHMAPEVGFRINAGKNKKEREFPGNFSFVIPPQLQDRYYHNQGGDDAVILLSDVANNTGTSCYSSGLLWGTKGELAPVAADMPANDMTSFPATSYNSCNMGFNAYREYRYANAVENYRRAQQSWNVATSIVMPEPTLMASPGTMPLIIGDNPWISSTDNNTSPVLTLSIDRALFGSGNMFDNATAMLSPKIKKEENLIGERILPTQWDNPKSSSTRQGKNINAGNQQITTHHQPN